MDPEFSTEITSTAVSVTTPYGEILNDWTTKDGVLSMKLKVPFNSQAEIILNKTELETMQINGNFADRFRKENNIEMTNTSNVMLGSGVYHIEYLKSES